MKCYYVSKHTTTYYEAFIMAESEDKAQEIMMFANEKDLQIEAITEHINCCKITSDKTKTMIKQTNKGYEVLWSNKVNKT